MDNDILVINREGRGYFDLVAYIFLQDLGDLNLSENQLRLHARLAMLFEHIDHDRGFEDSRCVLNERAKHIMFCVRYKSNKDLLCAC